MVSVGLDESFIGDAKWWLGEHEHLVGLDGCFAGGLGLDEGISK